RRGRTSVEAPPFPGDEKAHLNGGISFAERELERLSRLVGDDRRRLIATRAQRKRKLTHDLATFHRSPGGPLTLSAARRCNRCRDVGLIRARHRAQDRAVRRTQLLEAPAAGRFRPTTVDEVSDL